MIYEDFLAQFTDWRPTQLYWQRFSIAESYGKAEIQKVYNDIFKEAKSDYKFLTELVMVLNHKTWQHCEDLDFSELCDCYTKLFRTASEYAKTHLTGNGLKYYLSVTD